MTYDDAIAAARRQDAGELPGPDFMQLAASMDARAQRSATVRRIAIAIAAVVVVAIGLGSAAWLGSRAVEQATAIDRTPVQAVLERVRPTVSDVVEQRPAARPRPQLRRRELSAAPPEPPIEIEDDDARPAGELAAPALYQRAEQHMARRDYLAARKDLRLLLRRFPGYAQRGEATIDLARVEERLGRGQTAACVYARYLAEHATGSLASDARRALDRLARSPAIDVATCR